MATAEKTDSRFYETGVFGHNPFVYKGEVYRFNPTVTTVEQVLKLVSAGEKSLLKGKMRSFFALPNEKPVIVGIIDRVFDEPLLGGVKATAPEGEKEAKEVNDWLTEMNGIEFHRQYYEFMVKNMFEGVVKKITDGGSPDQLSVEDFLYLFCINFFAKDLIGSKEGIADDRKKVAFFKKVFYGDGLNAFDYVLLGHGLPEDKTPLHFLVWEK